MNFSFLSCSVFRISFDALKIFPWLSLRFFISTFKNSLSGTSSILISLEFVDEERHPFGHGILLVPYSEVSASSGSDHCYF